MGYNTNFYGNIKLKSKMKGDIIKNLLKDREMDWMLEEITISDCEIEISGSWKNYHEEMEEFCQIVCEVDNTAEGEVKCDGEDRDDMWRLIITGGEVFRQNAEVVYEEGGVAFNKENITEFVNQKLNDKEFMGKILIEQI